MSEDKTIPVETQSQLIIDQFIRHDEKVLEKTYKHNFKIVRSYVMKNSGTEADAKDIFQEAMVAAWLNMKEGRFVVKNEFSLSAYIYKISKYKWLDRLKSKPVKSTVRMGENEIEDFETEMDLYNDSEEKIKYLSKLYSQLDEKCKAVLNSFYYEKKPLEEIANIMEYDVGSIRTIKYRCMQKLRKMHSESGIQFDE